MAQNVRGFPWEGLEYNEQLSPRITKGLGRQMLASSAEAAQRTGLFHARYDDAATPQMAIRPALQIQPSQQAMWQALLNGNVGVEAGNGS